MLPDTVTNEDAEALMMAIVAGDKNGRTEEEIKPIFAAAVEWLHSCRVDQSLFNMMVAGELAIVNVDENGEMHFRAVEK